MSERRLKSKHRHKKNAVRELPEEDPDFQIAPMIDVLLVLLVFFMSISSTEVLQSTKGIELPVATDASEKKQNKGQIIVNVSWTAGSIDAGGITIDEKAYPSPDAIVPLLKERVAANPQTRVLVRADKQALYAYIRAIMIAVGQAGIGNVTFSVVDKPSVGQAPAAADAAPLEP